MTFLIHRLSDELEQLPVPPNAGQTIIRVSGEDAPTGRARYRADLVTRTEEPNPVNPDKGMAQCSLHTEWYNPHGGQEGFNRLCSVLGVSMLTAYQKGDEVQEQKGFEL